MDLTLTRQDKADLQAALTTRQAFLASKALNGLGDAEHIKQERLRLLNLSDALRSAPTKEG